MCDHGRVRSFATVTATCNAEAAKAEEKRLVAEAAKAEEKRIAAEADKAEVDRIVEVNPEEERLAAVEPEMRPLPGKTSGVRDGYRKRKEKEKAVANALRISEKEAEAETTRR